MNIFWQNIEGKTRDMAKYVMWQNIVAKYYGKILKAKHVMWQIIMAKYLRQNIWHGKILSGKRYRRTIHPYKIPDEGT